MDELITSASENPESIDSLTRTDATTLRDALAAKVQEIAAGIDESTDVDADLAALEEARDRYDRTNTRLAALDVADSERAEKVAKLTKDIIGIRAELAEEIEEAEVEVVEEEAEVIVVDKELEAVAASSKPTVGQLAKRRPAAAAPDTSTALVASSNFGGGRIADVRQLAQLMERAGKQSGRPSKGRTFTPVAAFDTHRTDRFTVTADPEKNGDVFAQVAKAAQARATEVATSSKALVAAGGFCAPAEPVYELFRVGGNFGGLELPTVNAPRGRVTYVTSPTYEDFRTSPGWWNAAGDDYTATEDAADTEKNVYVVDCPDTTTCEVVAHPAIVQFSNFQGRFYPEYVSRIAEVTMLGHFNRVNTFLINAMVNNGVAHNVANVQGGTYVQFFQALRFHTALMRETYRLPIDSTLELAIPHWVIDALAADRVARDATLDFAVTRQAVRADIASVGVRVQEVYGWQGQNISGDQPGTTAMGNFPAVADVLLWIPGSAVRLDGGTLNLGEVRDSTLNNVNNYQTFVETWEQVCFPGPLPWLLDGINVCPTGGTGARVTVVCDTGS